jgi:hypothetical protein
MSLEGEAKALMNNEAFVQALNACQQYHLNQAMTCDAKDDHGRRVHLEHAKNVNRIVGHLNALIQASKTGQEVDHENYYQEQARKKWGFLSR